MLTDDYRSSIRNDFTGWVAGHRTTRAVEVTAASLIDASIDGATVSFELQSTDAVESGELLTKAFRGTWELERGPNGWSLAKPHIRELKANPAPLD